MQCQSSGDGLNPTEAQRSLLSNIHLSAMNGSMSDSYRNTEEDVMLTSQAMSQANEDGKTLFNSKFVDSMEMYADAATVADYLDAHPEWFTRCAQPLKTEPLGDNGYVLVIGRYGNFGYEIEPKVGLHLLPQDAGVYRIETIAVPNYEPAGYDIDFRASMELVEHNDQPANRELALPKLTHVQWSLDLNVTVHFPKFIQSLPSQLVQRTGDVLLENVVKQISRRLTKKVQEDFHSTRNLPLPKNKRSIFG
jgi:hypothetical protein